MNSDETVVRETILEMNDPFNLVDLLCRLSSKGINNQVSITSILDDMETEGLIMRCKTKGLIHKAD